MLSLPFPQRSFSILPKPWRAFSLCSWKGSWNASFSRKPFLEKISDTPPLHVTLTESSFYTFLWHFLNCTTYCSNWCLRLMFASYPHYLSHVICKPGGEEICDIFYFVPPHYSAQYVVPYRAHSRCVFINKGIQSRSTAALTRNLMFLQARIR